MHFTPCQCHLFEYQTPLKATSMALFELHRTARGRQVAQGRRVVKMLSQNIDGLEPVLLTLQLKIHVDVLQAACWKQRHFYLSAASPVTMNNMVCSSSAFASLEFYSHHMEVEDSLELSDYENNYRFRALEKHVYCNTTPLQLTIHAEHFLCCRWICRKTSSQNDELTLTQLYRGN